MGQGWDFCCGKWHEHDMYSNKILVYTVHSSIAVGKQKYVTGQMVKNTEPA
jgi:hypothetical protein